MRCRFVVVDKNIIAPVADTGVRIHPATTTTLPRRARKTTTTTTTTAVTTTSSSRSGGEQNRVVTSSVVDDDNEDVQNANTPDELTSAMDKLMTSSIHDVMTSSIDELTSSSSVIRLPQMHEHHQQQKAIDRRTHIGMVTSFFE